MMELPVRIIMDGIEHGLRGARSRSGQRAVEAEVAVEASHAATSRMLSDTITEGLEREAALRVENEKLRAAVEEGDRTIESWVRRGFKLSTTLSEIAAAWAPPGRAPDEGIGRKEVGEICSRAEARLNAMPAQQQSDVLAKHVDAVMPPSVSAPTKRRIRRR